MVLHNARMQYLVLVKEEFLVEVVLFYEIVSRVCFRRGVGGLLSLCW
jgi:hypothetical protein